MIEYAKSYEFMSMLALFTYWIPALICTTVYLFRFVGMYRIDLAKCEEEYYRPSLTVGVIIWLVICAITPAINLIALVFDCAGSTFKWLGRTFETPLVRARPQESK